MMAVVYCVLGFIVVWAFLWIGMAAEKRKDKAQAEAAKTARALAEANEQLAKLRQRLKGLEDERWARRKVLNQVTPAEWARVAGNWVDIENFIEPRVSDLLDRAEEEKYEQSGGG